MRRALHDFDQSGGRLPPEVNPMWLTLGNVQTDLADITLQEDRLANRLPALKMSRLLVAGIFSSHFPHAEHAMRSRGQSLKAAYAELRESLEERLSEGCNPVLSWQKRALRFGSGLHTLQDSYCTGHAERIDNGEATSPLIDMFTYPSRRHPLTTTRDNVWQDKQKTAFKPEAAAAILATVAALDIFATQDPTKIEPFVTRYLAFRPDIRTQS